MYMYLPAAALRFVLGAGILSESEIEKCSRPMRYENDYIICYTPSSTHCL